MTYEYRCQSCAATFEVQATLAEKQAGLHPVCPQCHSPQVAQRFASIGVLRGGVGSSMGGCGPAAGPGCCGSFRI
jgi:putative FmdB family regulatory protein